MARRPSAPQFPGVPKWNDCYNLKRQYIWSDFQARKAVARGDVEDAEYERRRMDEMFEGARKLGCAWRKQPVRF
jgi:hypothetical protein